MTRLARFRTLAVAALAGLLLAGAGSAHAQTFPKLTGRVVDSADLLPPDREAAIGQQLAALETATGHQMVVATVKDLEGNDVADYGYRLGRAWGIGGKDANDGVVFLIAPNERRMHIAVGYGLEPVLTDAMSGRIIRDKVTPLFKGGDYPAGIQAGVDAIAEQIQLPPEEAALRVRQAEQVAKDKSDDGDIGGLIFVGFIVFFFFILPILTRGGRRRHRRRPWDLPIVVWGSGLGSGWSSGSGSSWGSGGGSSWGGGGGGFSGGGGSFGGGGASGGW